MASFAALAARNRDAIAVDCPFCLAVAGAPCMAGDTPLPGNHAARVEGLRLTFGVSGDTEIRTRYVRHFRPASPNGQYRRWEGEALNDADADRRADEAYPGWFAYWTGTLEDEPDYLTPHVNHGKL
jgi:hypothetical protein